MRAALDVIHRGKLHVRDLVTRVCAPEEAPEVYAALRDPQASLLTAAFRWR
jgi:threonine dehydrogenase-like Zn-dependent dehydrogenase